MKNVTAYYKLTPKKVLPRQLKLDPNNPRLSLGWNTDKRYTENEIRSESLQEKIANAISQGKHHIKELVLSITTKGFVTGAQPIIVSQIGSSNDFLVLEGNRRTTAIRHIASRPEKINAGIIQSIEYIPVQVFEYIENKECDKDEVIDVLLGTIHIEGPEEWGAMQKAYYIYRSYARELVRNKKKKRFEYDSVVSKTVGETFSMSVGKTKEILGIFRIFQQLKNNKFEVNPNDFSLIQLAIKPKCQEFFRYDIEQLKMTPEGLDRFGTLCLGTNPPVKNPGDFNAFAYVIANGTPFEQSQVLDDRKSPRDIKQKVLQRNQKYEFREDLKDIKKELGKLKLSQFQRTQEERNLIKEINNFVKNILVPLAKKKAK